MSKDIVFLCEQFLCSKENTLPVFWCIISLILFDSHHDDQSFYISWIQASALTCSFLLAISIHSLIDVYEWIKVYYIQ